eukprot:TRINITY_DN5732_c0_g1_i2.p1 TRINITY_DN5732_c0_g1~~TRINITY_DN5732_c0_g1_i2.p1  ORF type:complete len:208 (+),score=47.73 TRINITY_DN5732_c0_g1_i2:201-824(+)
MDDIIALLGLSPQSPLTQLLEGIFALLAKEETWGIIFASFVTGYLFCWIPTFLFGSRAPAPSHDEENLPRTPRSPRMPISPRDSSELVAKEEYKLMLCVRMDLKMGKGKVAAQCGHATLGAFKLAAMRFPLALRQWEKYGQAKVVVKLPDAQVMNDIRSAAKARGLPTHVVVDAGRTQIAGGSETVLAIGPAPKSEIDKVTGSLKLM